MKLSVFEIPFDKEVNASCRVETRTKLREADCKGYINYCAEKGYRVLNYSGLCMILELVWSAKFPEAKGIKNGIVHVIPAAV